MPTMDYSLGHGGKSQLIEGRRKTWRRNFSGTAINPDYWTVTQPVAGQTYSVAGGSLTVNMNTTANAETVIQSVEGFTLPLRVQWHHSMSQRIADNHVYLELVNAEGDTYQGWYFTGTTTTNGQTVHMNGGASQPASPSGTFTITATSTTAVIREIDARIDAIDYADRTADSIGNSSARVTRSRTTLDPNEKYFVRMRFKNGAVAPASNTINTIETVLVQDINDIPVEVVAGRGNNASNRTVPVTVNNTVTVSAPNLSASSTNGTAATAFRQVAVTNAAASVKGSAGKLFGLYAHNPGAAAAYLNIYNIVAPTIGTSTPTMTFMVPANGTIDLEQTLGVNFSTAIVLAATDTSIPLSAVAPASPLVVTGAYI